MPASGRWTSAAACPSRCLPAFPESRWVPRLGLWSDQACPCLCVQSLSLPPPFPLRQPRWLVLPYSSPFHCPALPRPALSLAVPQAIDQEKLSLRQSLLIANAATAAAQSRLEEEIAAKSDLQHRVDELAAIVLSLEDRLGRASGVQSTLTSAMTMGP